MARYIDKDKVLNRLRYLCEVASEPPQDSDDIIEWALLQRLEKEFSKIPTADVEEVRHGKWIEKFKDGFWYYDCPFCDDGYVVMERDENKPNYCHNCGAKMDGGKEE